MVAKQFTPPTPQQFRAKLLIDTDDGPQPWATVAEEFQHETANALDSSWMRVAGVGPREGYHRAMIIRPRGHSKTTDASVFCSYALFAAQHQISGVAAASTRDQARLLRDAIQRLTRLNPFLAAVLDVNNYRITNRLTGSTLEILSSDAPGTWGLTPTFIVADELTTWNTSESGSNDLWESLFSASVKRRDCLLLILTNAGWEGTWQAKVRDDIRNTPGDYFHSLPGPVSKRFPPDVLEKQRRGLTDLAYLRVWENQWIAFGASSLLSAEQVLGCCTQSGPIPGYMREYAPFASGLDLGILHDHSSHVGVGLDFEMGLIRLAFVDNWAPSPGRPST